MPRSLQQPRRSLIQTSLRIAHITDEWVDDLAGRANTTRIGLLRAFRTRTHLARAVAAAIVEDAERTAASLLSDRKRPPDGDDARSYCVRAAFYRLRAIRDAADAERSKAELARLSAEMKGI